MPDRLNTYMEAAYVYYIRPELGIVLMHDLEWDALGRELEAEGLIKEAGSLFYVKANEYPQHIIDKYKDAE